MSDKKISQLTSTSSLNNTDILVVVQDGVTKQTPYSTIKDEYTKAINDKVDFFTPLSVDAEDGVDVDLDDSAYDSSELIKLSWTGGNGSAVYTLPDATSTKNTNRIMRFISDSTFHNSTHVRLTPASGQNIDGDSISYDINKAYEGITLWSDGTEWFVIQKKG